jgi:hypothetical protein
MPKVICYQMDCLFNVDQKCRAQEVEFDPVDGCVTAELREEGEEQEGEEHLDKGGMHLVDEEE